MDKTALQARIEALWARRDTLTAQTTGPDRAGVEEALTRATELSVAGPARAASFTWDATARAHDRVYELAARSR